MGRYEPTDMMDRASRSNRYFRNAVERHWDPADIDLAADVSNLLEHERTQPDRFTAGWEGFLAGLALFGAGEDAVAEDLAPLAVVLEDIDDQLFVTTQLYEEAKHADFFDRYWREVVWPIEDELGHERSSPRADRWFIDEYVELFDRNRLAMYRLLEEDTPETRAIAYTHYHLTIEGIIAQAGYWASQRLYDPQHPETVDLPGLVEGFSRIRSDEGRHVGFGMHKLAGLIEHHDVDPSLVESTITELLPLLERVARENPFGPDPELLPPEELVIDEQDLLEYVLEKHAERMAQLRGTAEFPDIDQLVTLED